MGLLDLLGPLMNAANLPQRDADDHFDRISGQVPHDELGHGVAEAFRSDRTPPFPDMVSQLFGRSDPTQRAGMLNQIIGALGPAILSGAAGNVLGRVLGGGQGTGGGFGMPGQGGGLPSAGFPGGTVPQVTPEQAERITPEEMREIAAQAQQRDPSIMDQLGQFYARNPQLVKMLGGVAMAIMAGRMAERMRGR